MLRANTDLFDLFYYSQLQLCVIAACLTAANSAVLVQRISWECVVIVALSTFIVYTIDNLVDWAEDINRFAFNQSYLILYRKTGRLIIPIATLLLLILAYRSGSSIFALLSILGLSSFAVVIPRLVYPAVPVNRTRDILPNRLFVSLIWAIVVVLIPVWYLDAPLKPQIWMALGFVWHLTFISAVLWSLEILVGHKPKQKLLLDDLSEDLLIKTLQLISVSSAILAIVDIILGYFPLYNIVVVLAPIINLIALIHWKTNRSQLRVFNTSLTFAQVVAATIVTVVHLKF